MTVECMKCKNQINGLLIFQHDCENPHQWHCPECGCSQAEWHIQCEYCSHWRELDLVEFLEQVRSDRPVFPEGGDEDATA